MHPKVSHVTFSETKAKSHAICVHSKQALTKEIHVTCLLLMLVIKLPTGKSNGCGIPVMHSLTVQEPFSGYDSLKLRPPD